MFILRSKKQSSMRQGTQVDGDSGSSSGVHSGSNDDDVCCWRRCCCTSGQRPTVVGGIGAREILTLKRSRNCQPQIHLLFDKRILIAPDAIVHGDNTIDSGLRCL